jgi:hypothetical protein
MKIDRTKLDNTSLRSAMNVISVHSENVCKQLASDDEILDSFLDWQIYEIQKHLTRAKSIMRELKNPVKRINKK